MIAAGHPLGPPAHEQHWVDQAGGLMAYSAEVRQSVIGAQVASGEQGS